MVNIEKIDILELLPQRRPFVMVDTLTYCDETTVSSVMKIKPGNIFVANGIFTEAGIIENIAQTCAARMGYINKYIQKGEVKLGFIGAIKNMVIEKCPFVDDELTTTVDVVKELFSTLLVKAWVRVDDELIASGEMKISITDIVSS